MSWKVVAVLTVLTAVIAFLFDKFVEGHINWFFIVLAPTAIFMLLAIYKLPLHRR